MSIIAEYRNGREAWYISDNMLLQLLIHDPEVVRVRESISGKVITAK